MDLSEQAVLKAKQVLSQLCSGETCLSVVAKKIKAAADSLKSRLRDNLIYLYAEDYCSQVQDGTRNGMEILEEIRGVEKKLGSSVEFVTNVHAAKLDAVQLLRSLSAMVEAGVMAPPVMLRKVWGMLAAVHADQGNFAVWVTYMKVEGSTLPQEAIETLGTEDVATFQEETVVDAIVKLLRAPNMIEPTKSLCRELQSLTQQVSFASESFRTDLTTFCRLVLIGDEQDEQVEAVYALKKQIIQGAAAYQSRFARALKCFPTGGDITAYIDKEYLALEQDKGILLKFKELKNKGSADEVELLRRDAGTPGVIGYPEDSLKKFETCNGLLEAICSGMSWRFKSKHGEELDKIHADVDKAAKTLIDAAKAKFFAMIARFFDGKLGTVVAKATPSKKDNDDLSTGFHVLLNRCLPSVDAMGLQRFCKKSMAEEYQAWLEKTTNDSLTLQTGITALIDSKIDFSDTALLSLVELMRKEDWFAQISHDSPSDLSRKIADFKQKVTTVLSKKGKTLIFEGILRKFVPLAGRLQSKTGDAEGMKQMLSEPLESMPGVAAALELAKVWLENYRPLVPAVSVQVSAGSSVSSDWILWAPILAKFRDQCSMFATSTALPESPGPDTKEDSGEFNDKCLALLSEKMKHCETAEKTFKEVSPCFDWCHCDEAFAGKIAMLKAACQDLIDTNAATLCTVSIRFFGQIISALEASLLEFDKTGLEEQLASYDARSTALPNAAKDSILPSCSSPAAKVLYKQWKWFNEATKNMRDTLAAVCGQTVLDEKLLSIVIRAGSVAASMTMIQALWRPLRETEDRASLLRRCIRGLSMEGRKEFMKPHASVSLAMDIALKGGSAGSTGAAPSSGALSSSDAPKRPATDEVSHASDAKKLKV